MFMSGERLPELLFEQGGDEDAEENEADDGEEHHALRRRVCLYIAAASRSSVIGGDWAASFKPATCGGGGFAFVAVAVVGADVGESIFESTVEAGVRV